MAWRIAGCSPASVHARNPGSASDNVAENEIRFYKHNIALETYDNDVTFFMPQKWTYIGHCHA